MPFCKTTNAALLVLAVVAGLAAPAAAQTIVTGARARITERAVIGGATIPTAGVLRLIGVPARTAGQAVLSVDGAGDVTGGALAKSDLPAAVAFEDEANVFTLGQTITGTAPTLTFLETGGTVNRQRYALTGDAERLSLHTLTDAGVVSATPWYAQHGGSLVFNPTSKQLLPNAPYELQLGSPLYKLLAVHAAELRVETLVAEDTMATTRGRLLVMPTTSLIEAIADSATTIKVKHNNLASGDRVYLESGGRVEFLAVTSGATKINRVGTAGNASFEAGTTGWASDGVVAITSTDDARYVGGRGGRWVYTSGGANIYNNTAGTFASSTQYTVSIFVRRRSGGAVLPTATNWRIYIDGNQAPFASTAIDLGDGWYRLHATGTTTAAANNVVGLSNMDTDSEILVDGLQVEQGAVLTAFSLDSSSYTVTRNLDGSGADDWEAGTAVANTGQAGNGFIDLYSTRGVRAATEIGPSIVGNVRQSATYNDWAPRWAIGNLQGVYGYAATTYGAAFGDSTRGEPHDRCDERVADPPQHDEPVARRRERQSVHREPGRQSPPMERFDAHRRVRQFDDRQRRDSPPRPVDG